MILIKCCCLYLLTSILPPAFFTAAKYNTDLIELWMKIAAYFIRTHVSNNMIIFLS